MAKALDGITEVKELTSPGDVNSLLKSGWVLIDAKIIQNAYVDVIHNGQIAEARVIYILGKTN